MRYRTRTDIVSQILQSAANGANKTTIMYKSFLSYGQLKEYLTIVLESGLLERVEGNKEYYTSEKGKEFLRIYKNLEELDNKNITPIPQRFR